MKNKELEKNKTIKLIGEYILLFLAYAIIPSIVASILKEKVSESSLILTYIGNIVFSILCIFLYLKKFKEGFKGLKGNVGTYLKLCIKWWSIGLVIMMISNLIINVYVFNGEIATNESIIRDYIFNTPILSLISVCFIAPVVEEILFRISFRKMFGKNDKLFIICSGLFFGFLHASSNESLLGLLYIIPYGSLGSAFAYVYTKTNNVLCSIFMHILHNSVTFLLLYFAANAISLGAS